jgi:ADP-heptose:LPS heptosyltransferase
MHNQFKVLYVAPHGLGDLIMSLRAMEFLTAEGARITVLVKSRGEADYLRHTSNLVFDEILILDAFRKRGKFFGNAGLVWKLRQGRFSAAVPQMNVNIKYYDFMLRSAGIKGRRKSVAVLHEATALGGPIHNRHKVDLNVDMAAQILGVSPPGNPVAVWPSRPVRSTSVPRIALAPGSGEVEAHKRWPAGYYADLARSIRASYPEADIRIYGSPSEAALCAEIEASSKGAAVVAEIGSVTDLFDALRETDICVANCNGASHVAAHAGASVVGIYGPTQAEHTGAHCSRMVQVNRGLDCAPCYRRGYITGCGNPVCLTELEVDLVHDAVLGLLKGTAVQETS